MSYWAQPRINRTQAFLFSPTLDESLSADHPVRLYWEILCGLDWSDWEAQYNGRRGQPPIHPRIMAGAILYGLNKGIRSSRKLEDACLNRVDFMWLLEGRQLDHSTFADFRTRFAQELKDMFVQLGRAAMALGFVKLVEVATDGTRLAADSSRQRTATAKTLEEKLAELGQQIEAALAEVERQDAQEDALWGTDVSPNRLPEQLRDLEKRQAELERALEAAREVDAARKREGSKNPAKVPITDPDSRVLPSKRGGYEPNYTPMATTDGETGLIVDAEVINDNGEAAVQTAAVSRIEENFGKRPETALGDGAYGASQNVDTLEQLGVELLTPMDSREPGEGNPARRDDPTQPVPEAEWEKLPLRAQTKHLDYTAFVYDPEADCYWCPQGYRLVFRNTKHAQRATGKVSYRVYQCADCGGCPLASLCKEEQTKLRTVQRNQNEEALERVAMRMATDEAKKRYRRRAWIAETPFAIIKSALGIHRFLLRGLAKVNLEWDWICTAFNLGKFVRLLAALRAAETAALA